MTDCNSEPLHFSTSGPRSSLPTFGAAGSPTDAGALLLREVADTIGLFDALNAAIPDPRNPVLIIHDQRAMIAQRVTAIALGYEDLNDHQNLRIDPVLQLAAGKAPEAAFPLAAPPTLCRLGTASIAKPWSRSPRCSSISSIAAHPTPPDPSDPRLRRHRRPHPRQARGGRFFHGHYDDHCSPTLICLLRR